MSPTAPASRRAIGGLRGVRGEMLLLRTPEVALSRPVRLLHPRIPVYVVPRADHFFMVGATMIESDAAGPVTARSMMELLNAAYALHPAFGEAEIVETGVGLRPAYPDNLPRVKRKGSEISINGLYRHGFLLAPAMARNAAELILGRQTHRRASMKIIVNGEEREVAARHARSGDGRAGVRGSLAGDRSSTAKWCRRGERRRCRLADGDRIEILSPMQGG